MKRFATAVLFAATSWSAFHGRPCRAETAETNSTLEVSSTFNRFVAEKRDLAETIAKQRNLAIPKPVLDFFAAAQKQDWIASSNIFGSLEAGMYPPSNRWFPAPLWGAIHETYGTYELFAVWKLEFLKQFGTGIVDSIPP